MAIFKAGVMLALASAALAAALPRADAQGLGSPAAAGTQGTRLILLGTSGGPTAQEDRSQPASLLVVNGRPYLIDCGDGAVHQLRKAGFTAADVTRVFLTHLHFDHIGGLPSLMMVNWVSATPRPVEIYGPPGTEALVQSALAYLKIPEALYAVLRPSRESLASLVQARDSNVEKPRLIFQDDQVRVTAVENSHYAAVHPEALAGGATKSYSYRIDTPDRSVVFTGDTGPSDALAELAKGADILVSEVIDIDGVVTALRANGKVSEEQLRPSIKHMQEEHLVPEEVGKLAAKAGVKLVVLSHIAPGNARSKNSLLYTTGIRRHFKGAVAVGSDLDQF